MWHDQREPEVTDLEKLSKEYRKERVAYSTYLYVSALEDRVRMLEKILWETDHREREQLKKSSIKGP
jgi:hypothetical protein